MCFKDNYRKYKEEAIELLRNLISFESVLDEYNPNSDEPFGIENKKALNYLLNKASEDGFIVKNVDNYAGHIEYGTGDEILGILAHLDVVPVDKSEWISYPFKLDIRNGKMYGRGTMDDKGPLVCAYIAMKMLKDMGFKPKRTIRLIVGCDEESGSRCLEHYLECEKRPDLGFSPDAAFPLIYGEKGMASVDVLAPLDDEIIDFKAGTRYNMVPSMAMMRIKSCLDNEYLEYLKENDYLGEIKDGYYIAYGKAAHAMCPHEGLNAIYILFDFLNKHTSSKIAQFIKEYFLFETNSESLVGYEVYDEEMKYLTCNLAIASVCENTIKLGYNFRLPLDSNHELLEESFKKAVSKYGYKFNIISKSNRHYVSKDSELVKSLMKAYQMVTEDFDNEPYTIGGGTYAREIGNAVAFGPMFVGREDVCHIANEYIYEEDFDKSLEIYFNAIFELTK